MEKSLVLKFISLREPNTTETRPADPTPVKPNPPATKKPVKRKMGDYSPQEILMLFGHINS
ncbi:hypothetical protein G293_00325 [Candidatus Liberibacter africanus PTSAPSY]|uniref:Uncharacterized protein n=1 Tax=Candidatus Liberibacter africanus PTSAPSY TaxID=1277257 RepID=A0A0G3I3A5_LIBAF|nr:hypothetical protein G293_00325 [Candidatus Liberibacter africanus PTSAPSY]